MHIAKTVAGTKNSICTIKLWASKSIMVNVIDMYIYKVHKRVTAFFKFFKLLNLGVNEQININVVNKKLIKLVYTKWVHNDNPITSNVINNSNDILFIIYPLVWSGINSRGITLIR